jgi:hypothetical protein
VAGRIKLDRAASLFEAMAYIKTGGKSNENIDKEGFKKRAMEAFKEEKKRVGKWKAK